MGSPTVLCKNKAGNLGPPHYFYYDQGKPTVTLRFSEQDHQYYEEKDGQLYPRESVTTILRIIDKSLYLMPWAAKVMGEKLLATIPKNKKNNAIDKITLANFEALVKSSKSAWRDIRDAAGDVGSRAHECLQLAIQGSIDFADGVVPWVAIESAFTKDEDKRVKSCCSAAFSWMERHNVRWLKTESKVYSKQYKYAGTMDGLCLVDSCVDHVCCPVSFYNQCSIPDWKSSNHLSVSYFYQTAAYQHAEVEETGIPIAARWIHRLGKEDGKFESWYATDFDTDFSAFLAALQLSRIHTEVEKRASEMSKSRTARKVVVKEIEDLIASLDE